MHGEVYRAGENTSVPLLEIAPSVFARETTYDRYVYREIKPTYGWLPVKDQIVLDIGANVGYFSRWATDNGCLRVHAFEPEPCNFRMLERNAPKALATQAAVVSNDEKFVSLYHSTTGKNPGNTSTQPFKGREETRVPAVKFSDVLRNIRPSILKIDCEGAEYDFLTEDLPSYVKAVAMEIHLTKREWRESSAHKLIKLFADWRPVKEPKIGPNNWLTVGGWVRQ